MSETTYIVGGKALTMDPQSRVLDDAVIEVKDGAISSVESKANFQAPEGSRVVDAKNCLVMPGLVNGHTHLPMSLYRGFAEDLPLIEWLTKIIFPLEKQFGDAETNILGAQVSLIEMIRSGTTTINDMYYLEDSIAKAVHESGMRAMLGETIGGAFDNFDRLDTFLEAVADYPLIQPTLAPHSTYTITTDLIDKASAYAAKKGIPIHVHLSEIQGEVDDCLKTTGMTPVAYLKEHGIFQCPVFAAHGVVLTDEDIEILSKEKVGIVYNPESNAKLGTKICRVGDLQDAGIPVGLGTDGAASNNNLDLLHEADFGTKLQNLARGAGALKTKRMVEMMTIEGAKVFGLEDQIGSLEVGKRADIIALDLTGASATPFHDPYAHVVYSAGGSDVKHSMIDGKILMENRRLTQVDEEAILEAARVKGREIAEKFTPAS